MVHAGRDRCWATSGAIFRLENSVPEKIPSTIDYFRQRLLGFFSVCDARLAGREYFADELSVADLMLYPNFAPRAALIDQAGGFAKLQRRGGSMASRPAVRKGMNVLG